jgi:histidyl-tRNA synthetase
MELLGVAEPLGDVEMIALGIGILAELGVLGRTKLELNTLGDQDSRKTYRDVLVEYFTDHRDQLSAESADRLGRNPLRILDSKDPGDRKVAAGAPSLRAHLNQASRDFFAAVTEGLDALGIAYALNPGLVRGLDYYTHSIFEITTEDLGAQATVLGGGRYDGLIELLGGPPTPGVGWAAGIERLAMLMAEAPPARRPIAMVPMGAAAERQGLLIAQTLRQAGFAVDMGYSGNLKKRMRRANKAGARAAVILGDDELARHSATVRDLESGEQELVSLSALSERLSRFR